MIFLKIAAAWTLLSIILAPVIGGFLRRRRRETSEWQYLSKHPLPSGSIHDDRVSQ